MATRKTTTPKGRKLTSLIGGHVKVQQNYKDLPEGPFLVLALDSGFICLEINSRPVWINTRVIEVIAGADGEADAQ